MTMDFRRLILIHADSTYLLTCFVLIQTNNLPTYNICSIKIQQKTQIVTTLKTQIVWDPWEQYGSLDFINKLVPVKRNVSAEKERKKSLRVNHEPCSTLWLLCTAHKAPAICKAEVSAISQVRDWLASNSTVSDILYTARNRCTPPCTVNRGDPLPVLSLSSTTKSRH